MELSTGFFKSPSKLLLVTLALTCQVSFAFMQVRGTNLTIEESSGTRAAGLADAFLGLPGYDDVSLNHPASLANAQFFSLEINHQEQYGLASWDYIKAVVPFSNQSTMGFGIGRYSEA